MVPKYLIGRVNFRGSNKHDKLFRLVHFLRFLKGFATILDGLITIISFGTLYSAFSLKMVFFITKFRG